MAEQREQFEKSRSQRVGGILKNLEIIRKYDTERDADIYRTLLEQLIGQSLRCEWNIGFDAGVASLAPRQSEQAKIPDCPDGWIACGPCDRHYDHWRDYLTQVPHAPKEPTAPTPVCKCGHPASFHESVLEVGQCVGSNVKEQKFEQCPCTAYESAQPTAPTAQDFCADMIANLREKLGRF